MSNTTHTGNSTPTAYSHSYSTSVGGYPTGTGYASGGGGYISISSGMGGGLSTWNTGRVDLNVYGDINILSTSPRIILKDGRKIDLESLADMMEKINAILCLVKTHMESLDEYPALQAAYEEYKLVEAMVRPDDDDL